MIRSLLLCATALAVAGCQPKPAADAQPDYNTSIPMAELMHHVIDPAAFMFWRGSGWEITAEGERNLSPTTEEGWATVEDGASIVAETGNLLLMPGRVMAPEADWIRLSKLMTERALEAKAAAMKKDPQAVFDTGGRLYEVCVACHTKFTIEPAPPP